MLAEFLEKIQALAVEAKAPKVVSLPAEPKHLYGVILADGTLDVTSAEPEPRKHRAADLTAVVAFAENHPNDSVVWHSRSAVTCFLQDSTRRDSVTLPLTLSKQIRLLTELETTVKAFPQKAFINLLRINLHGSVEPGILQVVRQVRFRQQSGMEADIQRGKESVGRALMAELDGWDKLPETLTATVPVFDGYMASLPYSVECAIDVDPKAETFSLVPLPGEIERAIREAEERIGSELTDLLPKDHPLYYGTP